MFTDLIQKCMAAVQKVASSKIITDIPEPTSVTIRIPDKDETLDLENNEGIPKVDRRYTKQDNHHDCQNRTLT